MRGARRHRYEKCRKRRRSHNEPRRYLLLVRHGACSPPSCGITRRDRQKIALRIQLPAGIAVSGSPDSKLAGRAHPEPPHAYRTPFARDAARILHARAFRRLAGKTQVFTRLPAEGLSDHFRSRLTHTLEVAQISRTVAAALGLNVELAEALALAHDIGHPPFGHAGERALDRALAAHGLSFDHNLHALRIVTWFEERYPAFRGLNLTLGVREGIVKHSRDYTVGEHPELAAYFLDAFPPLEAQLIDLADEIAYLTADLDDGLGLGHSRSRPGPRGIAAVLRRTTTRAGPPSRRGAQTDCLRGSAPPAQRLRHGPDWRDSARVAALGATTLDEIRRAPGRVAALSAGMETERMAIKNSSTRTSTTPPARSRCTRTPAGSFSACSPT